MERYVFGGCTSHPENDLYRYDITTNDWCKVRGEGQTPSARSRFGMLIKGDKFYVLGGWDGETFLDDMYSFNIRKYPYKKNNKFLKEETHTFFLVIKQHKRGQKWTATSRERLGNNCGVVGIIFFYHL